MGAKEILNIITVECTIKNKNKIKMSSIYGYILKMDFPESSLANLTWQSFEIGSHIRQHQFEKPITQK